MTPEEIHLEFRKIGFSGDALNHPMDAYGILFRRHFNGVPDYMVLPWTWDYAPNASMREYNERMGRDL